MWISQKATWLFHKGSECPMYKTEKLSLPIVIYKYTHDGNAFFSLLNSWMGWGAWAALVLWLIFSSDNSSLFISFQSWWAMLRAAVGKEEKRLSSLPPPNPCQTAYKESIWAQCCAENPQNNREGRGSQLNLVERLKKSPGHTFWEKISLSNFWIIWCKVGESRATLTDKWYFIKIKNKMNTKGNGKW